MRAGRDGTIPEEAISLTDDEARSPIPVPLTIGRMADALGSRTIADRAFLRCPRSLPYLVIVFEAAACDEAAGYWFGPGRVHDRLLHCEADVERVEDADAFRRSGWATAGSPSAAQRGGPARHLWWGRWSP